jgi:hypothetical protein
MTKKRKRGRPRKSVEEKHTDVLNIKLTPAQRRTLKSGADSINVPLAVWARNTLLKAAKRLV